MDDGQAGKSKRRDRSLNADVLRFIEEIKTNHADRLRLRPKALKTRIIILIDQMLPPYRRKGGRPRNDRITRATEMFQTQCQEIRQRKRAKIDWMKIGLECVPNYNNIRSQVYSRAAIGRLRNSVYALLKRRRAHKPKASLPDSNTPTDF